MLIIDRTLNKAIVGKVFRGRLAALADLLDTVKDEQFDLGEWVAMEPGCGTVACACGWAGLSPAFIKQGFFLTDHGIPAFEGNRGVSAVTAFFGVGPRQFTYLFTRLEYPEGQWGPKDVAARIRQVLAGSAQ